MRWEQVPIAQVAKIVGGATPKSDNSSYWDGDIHWATPKDITNLTTRNIDNTERQITLEGLKNCSATVLPPNSVLFSSRAPIGHVAINSVPIVTNQGFKSIIPGPRLDPVFMYWWLIENREKLQNLGTGATFKELSKAAVERVIIPLPPLAEQQRIATVLDEAAGIMQLRQKALEILGSLSESLFQNVFGDLRTNPKGFQTCKLGDLITVSSGRGLTAKNMIPGEFPVYGGNGINGYHNEGFVESGRIIIGRVGVYCGSIHLTKSQCWVTDNAMLVTQKANCNTIYLSEALKLANLNQYAGRSSQPLLSGSRIYEIPFILPPEKLQKRFESLITENAASIELARRAHHKATQLLGALRQKAFTGEL